MVSKIKILIVTVITLMMFNTVFVNAQKVDVPTVEIPKIEAPKTPEAKAAEDFKKKLEDAQKKKEEKLPKPKGPVVGFIPFNYTYAVGEEKALKATNEIIVAMVKSQVFTPTSLKKWFDTRFKDGEGADIHNMIDQMVKFKVPAEYVCHGDIFKSGNEYGIRIGLFPVGKPKQAATYYYRSFTNFNEMPNIAFQIMEEIKSRGVEPVSPLLNKKILINTFDLNYLIYTISETGETNISPLPFIALEGMEYKKEDFFNNLMLYNFGISRIYHAYTNNIKDYTQNTRHKPTIAYDYIVNSSLRISSKLKTCTIVVTDGKGDNVLFEKVYRFDKLQLTDFYNETRKWVKDITIALLSPDELKKVGEVSIDGKYSDDSVYLDEFYLGNGDQKNLLVPINADKIKIWTGETSFSERMWTKDYFFFNSVNVSPYQSGISKPKTDVFKLSLGMNILGGFFFHPQYNSKQEVIFRNQNNSALNEYFNLGDILNSPVIQNKFNDSITYTVGLGADLSFESKYIMLTNQLNIRYNYLVNKFNVAPSDSVNLNSTEIDSLDLTYSLKKHNFSIDYSFLPSAVFLRSDSPFRVYAGLGVFTGTWVCSYDETISGSGFISTYQYILDISVSNRQSVLFTMGVYPEVGAFYKFGKFNFKVGVSYYFDVFKTGVWTNSQFNSYDTFNLGTFIGKIGFGYYLK
jgi:hypothetical protein